ncbi:MAG: type II toxin-antitoxin system RelE/ParE family toxin [Taibaiella sp.]|nr:type II toxin-antitoxin system RelE/ParE family toxin [Taibaiella sp.]
MSYTVVFSERANRELTDSWKWYEERKYGLGDQFTEAVLKIIAVLESNPEKGLLRNTIFKEVIVKKFPFLIIYRVEKEDKIVFIHSIFHSSRNPTRKYKA